MDRQAAVVSASTAHNYRDARGPACPSLLHEAIPELPLFGGLHVQHPGPCAARRGCELRPRQTPEVPQAASAVKSCPRVSANTEDFQGLQSKHTQLRGVFPQDEQRTGLQGQRPHGLALWTDKNLKRDSVVVGRHVGTLME
uniref:Uncharacterized protein n=1 Tax=Fundulus heteroclitus TaxID=8078 RepID=A0A146R648_FUNHE